MRHFIELFLNWVMYMATPAFDWVDHGHEWAGPFALFWAVLLLMTPCWVLIAVMFVVAYITQPYPIRNNTRIRIAPQHHLD